MTALNTRRVLAAALALTAALATFLSAPSASAQSRAEAEASSQQLQTDPELAIWDIALTTDVLGPLFGSYGVRLELAPLEWLSLAASPAWLTTANGDGLALVVSAHFWPLARGLDGPFLGPNLSAARVAGNGTARVGFGAGGEAGWQLVWGGLAVALSGELGWATESGSSPSRVVFGVRLGFGWAWR